MKNWKTTAAGYVTALGVALITSPDQVIHFAGVILVGFGQIWGGHNTPDIKK